MILGTAVGKCCKWGLFVKFSLLFLLLLISLISLAIAAEYSFGLFSMLVYSIASGLGIIAAISAFGSAVLFGLSFRMKVADAGGSEKVTQAIFAILVFLSAGVFASLLLHWEGAGRHSGMSNGLKLLMSIGFQSIVCFGLQLVAIWIIGNGKLLRLIVLPLGLLVSFLIYLVVADIMF